MLSIVQNEKQFLASILDNPSLIENCVDNYCLSTIAKDLFNVLNSMYSRHIPFTNDHIVSEGNSVNEIINKETLENIKSIEYDASQFDHYYYRLKKDYAKYKIENVLLHDTLIETTKKGDLNVHKIRSLIDTMEDSLSMVESIKSIFITPSELLKKYQNVIIQRKEGIAKYEFGDSYLDKELITGPSPGKITTIFGSTGVGKSAYALNLVNRGLNKQIPVVYDSLEMDGISTMDRLCGIRRRIPLKHLFPDSNGDFADYVLPILEEEKLSFGNNRRFLFIEEPNQSVDDLRVIAKDAKKYFKTDYFILYVDLFTMLKGIGTKPQEIEEAMNRVHEIVKSENFHLVAVVQANREIEHRTPNHIDDLEKFRPKSLSNIKNSGAIAERSRLVFSVFRPKYYANKFFEGDPDYKEALDAMDDIGTVSLIKANENRLFSIKYLFVPEIATYFRYSE